MSRRRPENADEDVESSFSSESSEDEDLEQNTIDDDNDDNGHMFESQVDNILREDIGDSDDSISVTETGENKADSARLFVPSPDNTPYLNVHAKEFVPNFSSVGKEQDDMKQSVIERVKSILTFYSAGLDGNQLIIEYQRRYKSDLQLELMDYFPMSKKLERLLLFIEGVRVNKKTDPILVRFIEGSGFQKKTDPLIPTPGSTTPRAQFPPVKLMFYRKLVLDRVKSVLKSFREGLTDRTLYVIYGFVYASSLVKDLRIFYKASPKDHLHILLKRIDFLEVDEDSAIPMCRMRRAITALVPPGAATSTSTPIIAPNPLAPPFVPGSKLTATAAPFVPPRASPSSPPPLLVPPPASLPQIFGGIAPTLAVDDSVVPTSMLFHPSVKSPGRLLGTSTSTSNLAEASAGEGATEKAGVSTGPVGKEGVPGMLMSDMFDKGGKGLALATSPAKTSIVQDPASKAASGAAERSLRVGGVRYDDAGGQNGSSFFSTLRSSSSAVASASTNANAVMVGGLRADHFEVNPQPSSNPFFVRAERETRSANASANNTSANTNASVSSLAKGPSKHPLTSTPANSANPTATPSAPITILTHANAHAHAHGNAHAPATPPHPAHSNSSSPFPSPSTAPNPAVSGSLPDKVRSLFDKPSTAAAGYTAYKLMSRYRMMYGGDLYGDMKAYYSAVDAANVGSLGLPLVELLKKVDGVRVDMSLSRPGNTSTIFVCDRQTAGGDKATGSGGVEAVAETSTATSTSTPVIPATSAAGVASSLPSASSVNVNENTSAADGKGVVGTNLDDRVRSLIQEYPQGIVIEKFIHVYMHRYGEKLATLLKERFKSPMLKCKQLISMIEGVVVDGNNLTCKGMGAEKNATTAKKEVVTATNNKPVPTVPSTIAATAVLPSVAAPPPSLRIPDPTQDALPIPLPASDDLSQAQSTQATLPAGFFDQIFSSLLAQQKVLVDARDGFGSNALATGADGETSMGVEKGVNAGGEAGESVYVGGNIATLLPFSLFLDCGVCHRTGGWVCRQTHTDIQGWVAYMEKALGEEKDKGPVYVDVFGLDKSQPSLHSTESSDSEIESDSEDEKGNDADDDANGDAKDDAKDSDDDSGIQAHEQSRRTTQSNNASSLPALGTLAVIMYGKNRATIVNLSDVSHSQWSELLVHLGAWYGYVYVHDITRHALPYIPNTLSLSEQSRVKVVDVQLMYELLYKQHGVCMEAYMQHARIQHTDLTVMSYDVVYDKLKGEGKDTLIDSALMSALNVKYMLDMGRLVYECLTTCMMNDAEKKWGKKWSNTLSQLASHESPPASCMDWFAALTKEVLDLMVSFGVNKKFVVFDEKGVVHTQPVTPFQKGARSPPVLTTRCNIHAIQHILPSQLIAEVGAAEWGKAGWEAGILVCDVGRSGMYWTNMQQPGVKHVWTPSSPATTITSADILVITEKLNLGANSSVMVRAGGADTNQDMHGELHRATCMRNKSGGIYGITIHVGRALDGACYMLWDMLLHSAHRHKSLLVVGDSGSGKTTMLRDMACMLSKKFNVCIIDTHDHVAGDGDVPHASVGDARRMMVTDVQAQHQVIMECVQNHTPQVIVVDEITTAQEVMAVAHARQKGVRVLAGVHGNFRSLVKHKVLGGLVGNGQDDGEKWCKAQCEVVVELSRSNLDEVKVITNTAHAVESVFGDKAVLAQTRGRVRKQQEVQGRRDEEGEGGILVKTEQQLVYVQAVEI